MLVNVWSSDIRPASKMTPTHVARYMFIKSLWISNQVRISLPMQYILITLRLIWMIFLKIIYDVIWYPSLRIITWQCMNFWFLILPCNSLQLRIVLYVLYMILKWRFMFAKLFMVISDTTFLSCDFAAFV